MIIHFDLILQSRIRCAADRPSASISRRNASFAETKRSPSLQKKNIPIPLLTASVAVSHQSGLLRSSTHSTNMDSMRSLNRSLPSTPPDRPAPPEQLLQAFRQAALSVTNLYKSAASDHDSIRQAGYQDAIDDLLKFLDRENLGVQDGEGWRVRQWATAKYDGSYVQHSDGDEEDTSEGEQRHRSSSPEKPTEAEDQPSAPQEQENTTSVPAQESAQAQPAHQHQQPVFQFAAASDHTMQTEEPCSSSQEQNPPLRVEVVNRANRNAHKHNNRHTPRSTSRVPPTQSTASKRKLPFPDMSEIFNIGFDKKDSPDGSSGGGGGGGKRSRLV